MKIAVSEAVQLRGSDLNLDVSGGIQSVCVIPTSSFLTDQCLCSDLGFSV